MILVSNKFTFGLLLVLITVLIPKVVYGEVDKNPWDVDSQNGVATQQSPQAVIKNSLLKDNAKITPQSDANTSPELTNPLQDKFNLETPQVSQQLEKTTNEKKRNTQKPCNESNIAKPEFTPVTNLKPKNHNQNPVNPDNIAQPRFSKETDLRTNNHQDSCKPDNIKKPELTSQLPQQKKQTPPTSDYEEKLDPARTGNQQPTPEKPSEDFKYIMSPRIADNKKVNTFTTTIPLNSTVINHLTKTEYFVGGNFGDSLNTNFDSSALFKLNSQIKESLTKDNIFTIEQTGSYIQLQTVRKKNEVTISTKEPQTLFGTQIQLSLIGTCIFPGSNPDSQCAYTPGLVTDRNSIDRDTLLPKRIFQTSSIGDVVTQESIAAMQQPGFQGGANGQEIGVDLYFPNSGGFPGNTQSDKTSISREERNENTTAGFYSTVRQIVRVNDKEAVIGRTVRGYGLIADDNNTLADSALQLSNLLLPDIDPQIEGGKNPVNKNINQNLFLAANNVRLPVNSFTFYNGGVGRAETPKSGNTLKQLPPGIFNSVWIGVSPVTTRSLSNSTYYEVTGEPRILAAAGAEGGITSNAAFASLVNGQAFSTANLKDFYAQIYLAIFNQDVNFVRANKFTEEINYYPHISVSGNVTGFDDVWRYYGGAIAGSNLNAYIGTDYSKNTVNGWNYFIGSTIYTNPDADYYSQVVGSVSKKIPLGKNSNFVLSTGFNYAIDRKVDIGGVIFNSPASSVTLGARVNIGFVSLGLTNYFGDILPNSLSNTLSSDLTLTFSNNFLLSGYYTPINENVSRSLYGLQALWKLGKNSNQSIIMSWMNNDYNFGVDTNGNKLQTNNNVFRVLLKGNF
jgi:hypothetical protein